MFSTLFIMLVTLAALAAFPLFVIADVCATLHEARYDRAVKMPPSKMSRQH